MPNRIGRWWVGGALALVAVLAVACRSSAPVPPSETTLAGGVAKLQRPLPGDLAALYRLRVPSTGGLHLSLLATTTAGRLTVSEQFGSALSLAAWTTGEAPQLFDLRKGCRLEVRDVSAVLGVSGLPLPEAARLLGGRLPTVADDVVEVVGAGRLRVRGRGWSAVVVVAADPWRVLEVVDASDPSGWSLHLGRHTLSVPGFVRADGVDDRWAELELVRLQWDPIKELPPLPDVPTCPPAGKE